MSPSYAPRLPASPTQRRRSSTLPTVVSTASGWSCEQRRGIARLLAQGGLLAVRSVDGAAAEYASSPAVSRLSGHLPMALFEPTNQHSHFPTVETRAITPGPAVDGPLQPTIPFVFERSAAASLGIMMPSSTHPARYRSRRSPRHRQATRWRKTARLRPRLRRSRWTQSVSRTNRRISSRSESRISPSMPSMESALGESLQGSSEFNEFDEQKRSTVPRATLNGLFTQAADDVNGVWVRRNLHHRNSVVSRRWSMASTPTTLARYPRRHRLQDVRALRRTLRQQQQRRLVAVRLPRQMHLGSIRVSDRVPGVSSSAQTWHRAY